MVDISDVGDDGDLDAGDDGDVAFLGSDRVRQYWDRYYDGQQGVVNAVDTVCMLIGPITLHACSHT